MPKQFALPDLGEGIAEAQIVRVMVKPGDKVARDQYLMEVETDKAAVEIPSPYAGVAKEVHVKEGQTVNVGSVIVTFDEAEDGAQAKGGKPAPGAAAPAGRAEQASSQRRPGAAADGGTRAERGAPPAVPARADAAQAGGTGTGAAGGGRGESGPGARAEAGPAQRAEPGGRTIAPAAPAVRKLAREANVDIDSLQGSGPGGRVTKEDVERAAAGVRQAGGAGRQAAAAGEHPFPAPGSGAARDTQAPRATGAPPRKAQIPGTPDKDKWGPIYREPLTQIRKTIANQMKKSAFTIPHVTHCDEADISELDRVRNELNEATGNDPKLTVMTFIVKATCIALRRYPIFNSNFDEEAAQIIYKDYVNIGVAVDTERGLIVPVIRDADRMTMREIAAALRSIAERIRSNQFAIEDLRGGTFTITNVGALGGTFSTPIINHPEVAILGMGRSKKVPVLRDGKLAEALTLPLNLSFDHRATDGANAARFTREIIGYLEMPAKLLLD